MRPLRLSELAEAVILRPDDLVVDADARLTNNSMLLDICHGLVVRNGPLVTLAHDSVRTFLTGDFIKASSAAYFALDADKTHSHITSRCLTYLRLSAFSSGPVKTMPAFRARLSSHPLVSYAASSWPIHTEHFPLQPADESLILDFFATKTRGPNGSSFDSWVQFLLSTTELASIRSSHPIYYAASFNMIAVLRMLVRPELGIDLERRGGRFSSPPLYVAIWRNNYEAAEVLLRAGADPLARDEDPYRTTCYALAVRKGATELVTLMEEILEKQGRPLPPGRRLDAHHKHAKPAAESQQSQGFKHTDSQGAEGLQIVEQA